MATVAETILAQLGGQRFLVMTGAKNLMSDSTRGLGSLIMKLPSRMTRNGITHLRIICDMDDTYRMECLKVRGVNCINESERSGVYADNLQATFTELTGLDTRL